MKTEELTEAVRPYQFHGAFERSGPYIKSAKDFVGTCPFCGKERAFVVNGDSGQFVCHSKPSECGRSGNVPSFLKQFADLAAASMSPFLWRKLKKKRGGLDREVFEPWEVGYDPTLSRFIVPIKGPKGNVQDLRVMLDSGRKMGTAGRSAGCWNLDGAAKFKAKESATLFICEGEWDGMALHWLLKKAKVDFPFCVVGIPGAKMSKNKTEWSDIWKKFGNIVVMGDNDADGDVMAEHIWGRLISGPCSLKFLNWPDTFPDKYDIGDHLTKGMKAGHSFRKIWRSIEKLISANHRRMPFKGQADVEAAQGKKREIEIERPETNPTFEETVDVYSEFLEMTPHHIAALQFCFSVYLSTQWDDVPLWGFLCGVPGSGKTELLCSLDGCPESIFFSSMQSKALVSGFKFDPDPSLIPTMIDRCSIFKDWTELLRGNQVVIEETYNTLRGWFDGEVFRKFGNGVERKYTGRGTILAGVTNAIHSMNDAELGARFLKFQMPRPPRSKADSIVMAAMLSTSQEQQRNQKLKAAALAFLNRDMPRLSPEKVIPGNFLSRILALVNIIAMLRAKVEWSGFGYDKELAHRPEGELPTRLGKQLVKLAMSNMVVLGKQKVDEQSFELVERVAFNTAYGFQLDIVEAAMKINEGKNLDLDDIIEESRLPRTTTHKRLEDLELLGVVNKSMQRSGAAGRPRAKYTIAPSMRRLWVQAEVQKDHLAEAYEARPEPLKIRKKEKSR